MNSASVRIFGVPVRLEPAFLLVAAFLGYNRGATKELVSWVVVVLVMILVHEFGHAVAIRAFGGRPAIRLWAFGGLTSDESRTALGAGKEVTVSLAGIAAGLVVLGVPAMIALRAVPFQDPFLSLVLHDLRYTAVGWGLLNLLPILPLDGGHALRAVLGRWFPAKAERVTLLVSCATASLGAAYAIATHNTFLGWYGAFFALTNISSLRRMRDAPTLDGLRQARQELSQGNIDEAEDRATRALKERKSRSVQFEAAELMAWVHFGRGSVSTAKDWLARFDRQAKPSRYMRGYLLLREGRIEEAVPILADAFQNEREGPPSPLLVEAIVRADEGEPVIGALIDRLTANSYGGGLSRLQLVLHVSGHLQESADTGRALFALQPLAMVAYNIACSSALLGSTNEALSWLQRAVQGGFYDIAQLDGDTDFASLRASPAFQEVRTAMLSMHAAADG